MRWDERQLAMLREMGVRVWAPPADNEAELPAQEAAVEVAAPASFAVPTTARAASPAVAPAERIVPLPSTVASLDWPALRETVAACTACKLCEGRRQTVFGVGNERAHWMIVGEAPGEQEDRQGEPFVGKSGQLLDNMLRAVHLTRAEAEPAKQVYIANTIKCRPPANRNPEPEELAKCEPFLVRQVQLVRPKIIVAMGRFAVHSLLRSSEPIGRLRGRVHSYQGVPLIVTYHPAYLLRNPEDKAKAWDDLCLAVETSNAIPG
ncbi:MAG: uracil-DNA glycosylase [Burkholderiales bacterium]